MKIDYLEQPSTIKGFSDSSHQLTYANIIDIMKVRETWYKPCKEFYEMSVQPDIDGMLGGLSYMHEEDVRWSRAYLLQLLASKILLSSDSVLDVGGGIGRVSHYGLKPVFANVDLLEQVEQFVQESRNNFAKDSIRNRFCFQLQEFDKNKQLINDQYDCIWIQCMAGHITDEDLASILTNLRLLLKPGGKIIIKDNYSTGWFWFDELGTNILRPLSVYESVFQASGLKIVEQCDPEPWPENLNRIRLWVLD